MPKYIIDTRALRKITSRLDFDFYLEADDFDDAKKKAAEILEEYEKAAPEVYRTRLHALLKQQVSEDCPSLDPLDIRDDDDFDVEELDMDIMGIIRVDEELFKW